MTKQTWLIYGAYGYSGQLIVDEALRRGHKPILAGRSVTRLRAMAERLGLEYRVVQLDDDAGLSDALANVELVFHAAGPFLYTSAPMVQACLKARTHHLDIAGELSICEHTFGLDGQARAQGIVLMSRAGYDVIPTDCLARRLADQLPDATELELAVDMRLLGTMSVGTGLTAIEIATQGLLVRRDGLLRLITDRPQVRRVGFVGHESWCLPGTAMDLCTAFRSTGIPNITIYSAFPMVTVTLTRWLLPLWHGLRRAHPLRRLMEAIVRRTMHGPDEHQRQTGKTYVWGRVTNAQGQARQGWLITPEPYQFTAGAGVRSVERILAGYAKGALTPAQALGADFVLECPGVKYFDNRLA